MGVELPRAARIKLYHGELQYKLHVDHTMKFEDFIKTVKIATNTKDKVILKYIDDEGDPILLTSDEVSPLSIFSTGIEKYVGVT